MRVGKQGAKVSLVRDVLGRPLVDGHEAAARSRTDPDLAEAQCLQQVWTDSFHTFCIAQHQKGSERRQDGPSLGGRLLQELALSTKTHMYWRAGVSVLHMHRTGDKRQATSD